MHTIEYWVTADPHHIAQIASSHYHDTDDVMVAHFSRAAVRNLRDHARETRPAASQMSGQEEEVCVTFATMKDRVDFMMAVIELGGEIVPQVTLPASASAELVP
ncbi:hypothetical protein JYP51_02005 [Ponticoccus gilvus]|nr:hypothetical protein [Enemella evansiae]